MIFGPTSFGCLRLPSAARLAALAGAALLLWAGMPPAASAQANGRSPPGSGSVPSQQAPGLSWTDWADLALQSPVVLSVWVEDVDRLSRREAPDVPNGEVRAIVQADLRAAIRAPGLLPAKAAWRWQGTADARGRAPISKMAPLLIFAEPLTGGGDPEVQPLKLVNRHGQQPWSAEAEAIVRDVLTQALAPDGGPQGGAQAGSAGGRGLDVLRVRDAFRSEGDVPGRSESQFFLETRGAGPLTLVVTREPGDAPLVRVATGELVDRAEPVRPRTLLWRGLACGMPWKLPDALAGDTALAEDYALARQEVGPCGRTLEGADPARSQTGPAGGG